MINANTANQKLFVDRYLEERLPLDLLVDGRGLVLV